MAVGSIRKRADRYYIRARVREIDETGRVRWKQVERAAGNSRRAAERKLKEIQQGIDAKTFTPTRLTCAELGHKWLRQHVQQHLKAGTAHEYRSTWRTHIEPAIGGLRVDEVDRRVIRELLQQKRDTGLSAGTISKIQRNLSALFRFAIEEGFVSVNPATRTLPKVARTDRRRARGDALTPAQSAKLLEVCTPRWRQFFIVMLDTGLRRGEMIGLRWGDVNFIDGTIRVRRSIGVHDDPDDDDATTKTEAGERLVPMFPNTRAILEDVLRAHADKHGDQPADDAPVFATIECKRGRDGAMRPVGRPLSPRMVTRVWRRYADRAGLPESFRLHDVRHTTVTRLIAQGAEIDLIAAVAGHSKVSTTVDVYGHLLPERVSAAALRFNPSGAVDSSHKTSHKIPANNVQQRHAASNA